MLGDTANKCVFSQSRITRFIFTVESSYLVVEPIHLYSACNVVAHKQTDKQEARIRQTKISPSWQFDSRPICLYTKLCSIKIILSVTCRLFNSLVQWVWM